MKEKRITLTVHIVMEEGYEDLHIMDDHGHSCSCGDSNYGKGMTSRSIADSVKEFLRDYHQMK